VIDFRNKKILVTGGAGFIGSHVAENLLAAGARVVSLDNLCDFYDPALKSANLDSLFAHSGLSRFTHWNADIRDAKEMTRILETERPDAVIHLAAMAGVRPSIDNPQLYTEVNIGGTQNLLQACADNGVRHFIFASSSSVYGNNIKVPFSESDNVDYPISPYAATKKAGELLCHAYAHLYGMAVYCLRFFTVYGPRQRPDLAIHKFAKLMLEGKEIPLFGDGRTERDYTYIEDIVQGVLKALELNLKAETPDYNVINLGGSQTVSLNEMVSALEDALHVKARVQRLPKQQGDVERTYADIARARALLDFKPAISFRDGIQKFASWLLASRKELEMAS
jgi:UDP-glucuronate 4-epimerase